MNEFQDRVDRAVDTAGVTAPELVIFDCDGVLVDSEILSCRLEAELLNQIGVPLSTEQVMAEFIGLSYESMVRRISAGHGVELPADFQQVSVERFLNAIETDLTAVPGIDELLRNIPFPICVGSSSPMARIERSLAVTGLLSHFRGRIYSAQMVKRGKPAPDLFMFAAEQCNTSPDQCLVIEDSPYGVEAGVSANMTVIGFTAGSHCRETLAQQLTDAGAALVVGDSFHLQALLDSLAGTPVAVHGKPWSSGSTLPR